MGFAMTTVLLDIHNAGFYELGTMILAMGVFCGGLARVIAGITEWRHEHRLTFLGRDQPSSGIV